MNKYFKEVVTRGALDFKLGGHMTGHFGDDLMDSAPDKIKSQFKNVCAPIHISVATEMEAKIKTLGLSKREFITLAIQSALEEVDDLFNEMDITEYMREQAERRDQEK